MPRRKNATSNATTASKPRRSSRQSAAKGNGLPDVYTEMLVEAYNNNPDDFAPNPRPAKRRKVERTPTPEPAPEPTVPLSPAPPSEKSVISAVNLPRQQQVVFNNDYDDSDDSDIEFEDVEIDRGEANAEPSDIDRPEPRSLQIDLAPITPKPHKTVIRRKPVTKAERDFRLDVHKWHVLSLLFHLAVRNKWCDGETVQKTLKPLVSRKVISQLHLDEFHSQAKRKFSFDQAIEQICQIWKQHWKVTARGMRRAYWRENLDIAKEIEEAEDPVDISDFQQAAKDCTGSRDLSAQLFCALLRSVAVETRLVCSLQALPFSRVAKGETPQKPTPAYIQAGDQNFGTTQPQPRSGPAKKKQKKIIESPYPIFWVEVFNSAITTWIPLDPVVRNTINKPRTGFEPPASDTLNAMSYVIAFEDDGTAKDVTRRYVSAYNAKTLKTRVESMKHGDEWWGKVMRFFERTMPEPRDDVEDASLMRRVATEGMPKNVQDFKDHPVYVLERHLRANEVIEPKREAGKFTVGSGKNAKVENVYRRQDVHLCRSADAWYRRGRDVRIGENPLKRVVARNKRVDSAQIDHDADNDVESEDVALYAEYQTDIYIPPPILDGRVPRNGFGNLDVYVRSMIPAGGVHILHPLAAQAAKTLKIDFAEAVTGFSFRGRQGTAIVDGIVIDARYTAAMLAVTAELENELEEQVNGQRTSIVLSAWKKMLAVLRVRQRVQDEYGLEGKGKGKDAAQNDDDDDDDDDDSTHHDEADGGGFLPDAVEATADSRAEEAANLSVLKDRLPLVLPPAVVRTPVKVTRSLRKVEEPQTNRQVAEPDELFDTEPAEPGGFLPDNETENEADMPGGFVLENGNVEDDATQDGGFIPEDNEQAGGFVVEGEAEDNDDDDDQIGGFMPEAEEGGGFISEDDPIPEKSSKSFEDNGLVSGEKDSPLSGRDPKIAEGVQSRDANATGETPAGASTAKTAHGEADGNGNEDAQSQSQPSELSHDPAEDEMEPEWLADAFD